MLLCKCQSQVIYTKLCYFRYGWKFLYETYLYHIVRRDMRHNFSPYFYMLYLSGESDTSLLVKVLGFLPQILLLIVISFKFYRHPPFCWFLNTCAFVAANKVCTSQVSCNVNRRAAFLLFHFSLQPVLHDWCNKGCGMYYPVCGMMHIKEPLLLIGKSSLCGGSGFSFVTIRMVFNHMSDAI